MQAVSIPVGDEALAADLHAPDGPPKGSVLMVHGMLSSRRELRDTPEALAARGWVVLALDLRGHGESDGERGYVTRERVVEDVEAAVAYLRAQGHPVPVGMVGHSLGTVWTTLALAEVDDVAAGVLLAPLRTMLDEVGPLEELGYRLAHLVHRIKMRLGLGPLRVGYRVTYADLFEAPQDAAWAEEAGFLQETVNLRSYTTYLGLDNEEQASRVTDPVLVGVSLHDTIVDPRNQRRVFDALGGPRELLEVDAGHSLLAGRARAEVAAEVDAFLTAHVGGHDDGDAPEPEGRPEAPEDHATEADEADEAGPGDPAGAFRDDDVEGGDPEGRARFPSEDEVGEELEEDEPEGRPRFPSDEEMAAEASRSEPDGDPDA